MKSRATRKANKQPPAKLEPQAQAQPEAEADTTVSRWLAYPAAKAGPVPEQLPSSAPPEQPEVAPVVPESGVLEAEDEKYKSLLNDLDSKIVE